VKEFIAALKSKGYWQARLLPSIEQPKRWGDKLAIKVALNGIAVNFRGWDYPHVSLQHNVVIESDRVWQTTEWNYFREIWCAFLSGQFLHVAGMRADYGAALQLGLLEDHVEPGEKLLGIGDTVYRMTEFAHFASRYAQAVCPGEDLRALLEVGGLKDRRLVVDDPNRGGTSSRYVAHTEAPFTADLLVRPGTSDAELAREARNLANELYELFEFRAADAVLEGWQRQMIYYRPS
jgi:hypothetical protein